MLNEMMSDLAKAELYFIYGWNMWHHLSAMQPSLQWGRRWLRVVRSSKAALEASKKPIKTLTKRRKESICIIARASAEQEHGIFTISKFVESLQSLNNPGWVAYVAMTDNSPTEELENIIISYRDSRLRFGQSSIASNISFLGLEYGSERHTRMHQLVYKVTDDLIKRYCNLGTMHEWLLVTNGKSSFHYC